MGGGGRVPEIEKRALRDRASRARVRISLRRAIAPAADESIRSSSQVPPNRLPSTLYSQLHASL